MRAVPTADSAQQLDAGRGLGVRCVDLVHLYRTFEGHDVVALSGVNLEMEAGQRIAFLGPSGSGKSTLLSLIGAVVRPSAGRIFLGTEEITKLGAVRLAEVRSELVSTMLQGATRNLLPYATARQNLTFARLGLRRSARGRAIPTTELLALVGLTDQADQAVKTMSGGQRQRLALACAVANAPRLLLADEPTSQLSHEDRDRVIDLIHRIGDQYGTTIVIVTHEPAVAQRFSRTVTMRGGRVGSEARSGSEYVVVGPDGQLHLPAQVDAHWPAGTVLRLDESGGELVLARDHEEAR